MKNITACGAPPLDDASTTPLLRFTAQSMATFFYYAGSIGGPGLLLSLSAAAYLCLRPPLAAMARGATPLTAHLGRALALASAVLGLLLLIGGGVYAGIAAPQAAFMGAAIAIAAPAWGCLAFALLRARSLGLEAALADRAACSAFAAAVALSLAWEVAVTGLATQDRAGNYVYSFQGVGWMALSLNMFAAQIFTHTMLAPRGCVEPRALLALALAWAGHRARCAAAKGSGAAALPLAPPTPLPQPPPLLQAPWMACSPWGSGCRPLPALQTPPRCRPPHCR
jgi:hypothetical protein